MKTEVKSEEPTGSPKAKKAKIETIAKSSHTVVTSLVAPPSAEDLTTAGSSERTFFVFARVLTKLYERTFFADLRT